MAGILAFLRYVLFCMFFSAGVAAITISILANEIGIYYRNKITHQQLIDDNRKIEGLIEGYHQQISLIKKDPNILSILERYTFGTEPNTGQTGTVYPRASAEQLAAAAKAILNEAGQKNNNNKTTPDRWILRCGERKNRQAIALAGAALVIIAFMFFGASGPAAAKKRLRNEEEQSTHQE